jgi:hypothetical protein
MPKLEIPIQELRKRKLFVATPMYGGQCFGPYTKCCLDLNTLCIKHGIQVQFFFLFNESLITRARNYLVDEFMRSDATHMMFIDSDIAFNPIDVLALMAFDKPVIGGPYPKKTIAWEKVYDAAHLGLADDNPLKLEQFCGDYVFNVAPGTKEIRLDEPVEVLEIGTGFMMIKREAFDKFKATYPELKYKPDHNRTVNFDGSRYIHMYFQALIDTFGSDRYLSEDYMFCQWARRADIPVYLCPWMKLQHIGTYIFGGSMEALAQLSHKQNERGHATPVARDITEVIQRPPLPKPADLTPDSSLVEIPAPTAQMSIDVPSDTIVTE